jgi:tetratricopeptide repeat protein 21B
MLRNVPELSVHHTRSRIAASEIYLRHAKNRNAYAACFADLASKPGASVQAHVLLGEALMRIQEPDRAIRAYEDALKLAPSDATLASKIGRALVTTHDFGRAVRYYESAVAADPSRSALFHELIELLVKLGRLEEAGAKLRERRAMLPKGAAGVEDVHALIAEVRSCLLLARVHKHGGFSASAASAPAQGSRGAQDEAYGAALTDAWNAQKDVLRLAKGRDADLAARERDTAASIACQMAQYYQQQRRDPEQALGFYSEALKLNENHAVALLAMANLQSQAGEVDRALQTTQTLLRVDPANEEASALLADLLFRKGDHELAIGSFKALLERKSDHYSVLQRLIHLLRRAGRLADATRFLKAAAKSSARAEFDAGLHYCQGLHAWYSNDAREALKELNQARKDVVWGSQALQHMIEIYLNPDNQALFAQEVEGASESNSEALPSSSAENIKAAEKLLKELTAVLGVEGSARITILDAYIQMASGQKAWIEQAIRNFSTVLSSDPDNVPALLGQSHGFMLLKQQPKARNNLKRIAKMPVTSEHSEEFERSFLLLSDIYVEVGKYDLAAELCKKCIANNKSCAKAWEYLGVIMEKENAFKDAADHYERAWSLQNETSASVGFKLAFNCSFSPYVLDLFLKVFTQFLRFLCFRLEGQAVCGGHRHLQQSACSVS